MLAKLKRLKTTYHEEWIENDSGFPVYAHVHRPVGKVKYPGVVMVPGGFSPGSAYDKGDGPTAEDIASLGFVVMHYDPSGRGKTRGKEDYWGDRHQRELSIVLAHFADSSFIEKGKVGILSFSIGITIASGALAKYPLPFVTYLVDWEGPSNRFNITKNDTYEPLENFPSTDLEFWKEREANRFISKINCCYFRYQAEKDHVQGRYKGHAIELINLATNGSSRWTRLNENKPNIIFDETCIPDYHWIPWYNNHKNVILKYFLKAFIEAENCTRL